MNLLGFVLMMLFGVIYHLFLAAAASRLAVAHFWLHQVGTAVLLSLLLSGRSAESAVFPLAPITEVMVLLGLVFFAVNVWRHAK